MLARVVRSLRHSALKAPWKAAWASAARQLHAEADATPSYEPEEIIRRIESSPVQAIKVAAIDIDGIPRGKYINKDKFMSAAQSGFGFCNVIFGWDCNDVCYDNVKYTGWHSGYPDAAARIDLRTFREIPWEDGTPFFLADFYKDDSANAAPLPICPRQLLKSVIARTHTETGLTASFGQEFEWFNFSETPASLAERRYVAPRPLTPGMFGYSLLRAGQNQGFFTSILTECRAFRIPIEGLHTETGPGVLEAAIHYSGALEAADRAVLFKMAVKQIGHRYHIMPSFMAKPHANLPGCSGHLHQSLWRRVDSAKKKVNVFYDENDPYRMSELFKHYVAGQLYCMPHILPMYAPTINSYKRLVDGYWAPTKPTWGVDNRTVALRVIPGSAKSTRLETRIPGSDCNPYLAISAALASGVYGILNKLPLPPATVGSGYQSSAERLPRNLGAAAEKMAQSKLARELFGDDFVDHFVATREWEWRQYQNAVTNWEIERYFEII